MKKTILLLLFAFISALSIKTSAQYSTINIVSGFNADVVADSIGDPTTSISDDVDGVGYAFVASNYQFDPSCTLPTLFMPDGGLFNSLATTGLSFQLAPYDNNNDLRLTTSDSASLYFGTGVSAQTVYLLATSGSGSAQINATVNFSDGTSQTFNGIVIQDWFNTATNTALQGVGRVNSTVGACGGFSGSTTTPKLFQLPLSITSTNYSKTITSVTITRVDGLTAYTGIVNVMGISTFAPPATCTGAPNVGNTLITSNNVCSGANFTLSLQNPLTNTSGITYQWQSSTNGTSWTNIAGADSVTSTQNTTVVAYYHCVVTCTNSGQSTTSPTVSVSINPIYLCPCGPATGTTLHTGTLPSIDSASIVGTKLAIASKGAPANGYTFHGDTSKMPSLSEGVTYTLNTVQSTTAIAAVWFDWDHSGTFDASEYNKINVNGNNGILSFTVPTTATVGKLLMRIRVRYSFYTMGATDACTSFFDGETEDYLVNVTPPDTCASPSAISTSVAPVYACKVGTPEALSVAGFTGGNLSTSDVWQYQWTDTAGNVVRPWSTTSAYNLSPTLSGSVSYKVFMKPSHCAAAVYPVAGTTSFSQGYWGSAITTAASCSMKGSLIVLGSYGPDSVWYANDFSSATLDPNYAALYGNAAITGGRAVITPSATSSKGGLAILNPNSINTTAFTVDYDLTEDQPINIFGTGGGDGMAYSFGDDATYSSITSAPAAYGAGTKLRVAFYAVTNGNNVRGTYLIYGYTGTTTGPTPTSAGVLAYSNDFSWKFATDKHVSIVVNNLAQLTLTVGGVVLFNNVQLPPDYVAADKSFWTHLFSANTGGDALRQAITNLQIKSQFYLYSLDSTGTSWQSSPEFDSLKGGNYTVYVSDIFGSCSGTIGSFKVIDSCALPVKLISFKGNLVNNSSTNLKWTLGTLDDGVVFEIQRSTDSRNYLTIGKENAVSGLLSYNYTDAGLLAGHYYYRLKMTEKDGSFTYSNVVAITTEKGEILAKVYPNPINSSSLLEVSSLTKQTVQLKLTDMLGRTIMDKAISLEAGENTLPLGITNLTNGTYILQVFPQTGNSVTLKLVK